MKKFLICIIAFALLFAGCSNTDGLADSTPVLYAEDTVLLTLGDIRNAAADAELSERKISEEELYTELAETAAAAYIAEQLSLDTKDDTYWQEEYDSYMSAIADSEVYPGMMDYANSLMAALDMSEEEFKAWNVVHAKREYAAEVLLADIAACYTDITDPVSMSEAIRSELMTMAEIYGIRSAYPSLGGHALTFETLT